MIVITGAAGFIGSNLLNFLNKNGHENIIVVDTLEKKNYFKNLLNKKFIDFIDHKKGLEHIKKSIENYKDIKVIFHIGANADVLVGSGNIMLEENFEHSKFWFNFAKERNIPFIYASSSAVYGNSGCFKVDPTCECPHNEYAFSKWIFDNHVRSDLNKSSNKIIGFRFFNVFGWGEFHKGKNASLPFRFFSFIKEKGVIELFNKDIRRDYVWVRDVCKILYKSWKENILDSGIYNLGSGNPISHKEIAQLVIDTMIEEKIIEPKKNYIKLIPIPEELHNRFQYFTKAEDLPEWIEEITKDNIHKMKNYIKQLCKSLNQEDLK